MKVIKPDRGLPILCWAEDVDEKTLEQAQHLSQLPFAVNHIALMPDAHVGYGMPIGGVLATSGVIVPNAVGVDIGCGMQVGRFEGFKVGSTTQKEMKTILGHLRELIPVGFSHHKDEQSLGALTLYGEICLREAHNALYQVGTLGGGNHFIELQAGDDDQLYVMIHSGSRNLGKQVADHYNRAAIDMNAKWHTKIPPEWQLAFLPLDSNEGQAYIEEMDSCREFAWMNRSRMMQRAEDAIKLVYGDYLRLNTPPLDIAHNYAAMENHGGKNVMVHRKGATRARAGELGIIPGSQGSASYIVKGLGNPKSFQSCSHGAGRKMGRKDATRRLDLAEEQQRLEEMGVVHSVRNLADLDEAPGAYKSIEVVMAAQADLVSIVRELKPLAVVKG